MKNGQIWQDTDGNDIQAHGGCIINHRGVYYWYGEHKGGPTSAAYNIRGEAVARVDVIGVACYSSTNLVDWKYEGVVFESNKTDPQSHVHYSKVLERPKVVYNEKTGKFVLWMHVDRADYSLAAVGVAVSDSPVGPFELLRVMIPNRQDSRDMTVYKDRDGVAYLFHSKDRNKTMSIDRLTDDYTDVDGFCTSAMIDQEREAPAVFRIGDTYYMISSGCTGWLPNAALVCSASNPMGKWKLTDNPCEGENSRYTFFGQSAYVLEVEGSFYLLLDHWKPDELAKSGYSILKIEQTEYGDIVVPWQDEWLGIG